MICILGVSHRDKVQALRWLDHVWALSLRERGEQPPVIVMQTMRAAAESGTVLQTTKLHVLEWAVCPDENEVGFRLLLLICFCGHLNSPSGFIRTNQFCGWRPIRFRCGPDGGRRLRRNT